MHHYNRPGGMGHGFTPHGMMGYSWIWIIGIILLLLFVVIGFLLLLKQSRGNVNNNRASSKEDHAITILKERFAKGEITEEQYINKRRVLEETDNN